MPRPKKEPRLLHMSPNMHKPSTTFRGKRRVANISRLIRARNVAIHCQRARKGGYLQLVRVAWGLPPFGTAPDLKGKSREEQILAHLPRHQQPFWRTVNGSLALPCCTETFFFPVLAVSISPPPANDLSRVRKNTARA